MRWKTISFLIMASFLAGCSTTPSLKPVSPTAGNLQEFEARAAKFNAVVTMPAFETTSNQIVLAVTNACQSRKRRAGPHRKARAQRGEFHQTQSAHWTISASNSPPRTTGSRSSNRRAPTRKCATPRPKRLKDLEGWMVGIDYREGRLPGREGLRGYATRVAGRRREAAC